MAHRYLYYTRASLCRQGRKAEVAGTVVSGVIIVQAKTSVCGNRGIWAWDISSCYSQASYTSPILPILSILDLTRIHLVLHSPISHISVPTPSFLLYIPRPPFYHHFLQIVFPYQNALFRPQKIPKVYSFASRLKRLNDGFETKKSVLVRVTSQGRTTN